MYVQATDSSLVNLQWSVHPWNRFHGWTFHQPLKNENFSMSWKNAFVILSYKWNSVLEGQVLMCSQRVLHHHERCIVENEVFWSLKDFWRTKKDLFFFPSQWVFSFEKHFLHTCNWFCSQNKKNVFTTQCCFKKRTWKWQWKNTKLFTAKSNRILEDFWTLIWENEEISKIVYFFLFGEMKLVETLSRLIDIKLKQISNAQKKN